ncbi:MAG: PSD1 and planctomycete cytochrome C domain-containing protein [Planctomycetes bacterium]|nr:PSD1 and planctomycete cytochrome C domain-containing protein [Planctomycetota bacterium]
MTKKSRDSFGARIADAMLNGRRLALITAIVVESLLHSAPPVLNAQEPGTLFERRIASILSDRCASCHNPEKREGGLDVTSRDSLLKGGDSGPAITPGNADESWLLDIVAGDEPEMPKNATPLTGEELADLRDWIETGAEWPDGIQVTAQLWSLRPVVRPAVPSVKDSERIATPIDAFILRRLEEEGLNPAPRAERLTLIRRATFDLHGLPPTPEEIDDFLSDASPNAFAKVVDRLLKSPRYGERWGRHWLDLASYADSHGFELDYPRPYAWRYRDYVIQAFNDDKPYDEFLQEQLAGDILYPREPSAVIATGFLSAGPWDYSGFVTAIQGTAASRGTRLQDLDNMLTTVMTTTVGLTVGCAKCHDHKFDPIPQRDYYSLQAVFAGVRRGDRIIRGRATEEQARRMAQIRLDIHKKRIGVAEIDARAPKDRTEEMDQNRARLQEEIAVLEAEYAEFPEAELTYAVIPETPPATHILSRGDTESPLDEVAPAALSAVGSLPAKLTGADAPEGARRLALARWLTDPANPLTARVMANRLWQRHFGRGIVGTPGDFGFNGEHPSHPDLLDWLATEFQKRHWSIKAMHRLIMLSSTYQQSSQHDEKAAAADSGNRLLWRMNRRRLSAEEVRDSILAVSGELDLTMGGPADQPFRFQFRKSPIYDYLDATERPERSRRSIYNFIVRSTPDPFMDVLDFPVPASCTPARSSTNTPLQSLSLLNDPFVIRQADQFAARLADAHPHDVPAQVNMAYRLALGREPLPEEVDRAELFIGRRQLIQFCRVLFNTNEFLYVD